MPDSFTVEKTPQGLFTSKDLEGNKLVSSATEHQCRELTHFYLKGVQESQASYTKTKSTKTKND
jgi:hypothetical protein